MARNPNADYEALKRFLSEADRKADLLEAARQASGGDDELADLMQLISCAKVNFEFLDERCRAGDLPHVWRTAR